MGIFLLEMGGKPGMLVLKWGDGEFYPHILRKNPYIAHSPFSNFVCLPLPPPHKLKRWCISCVYMINDAYVFTYAKDQTYIKWENLFSKVRVKCLIKAVLVTKILCSREAFVWGGTYNTGWAYNLITMVIIL